MTLNINKSILLFFLLSIFIASGFKNDLIDLGGTMSVSWESFEVPSLVYYLKENSFIFLIFSFLIFIYFLFKTKEIGVEKNYFILFYLFLLSFSILRLFFGYLELSLKSIVSFLVLVSIYILLSISKEKYNIDTEKLFLKSFYIFGFLFFLINYYVYFSGMGYVYGFNRFFGSTAHPNFLGVQSAICLCLMSYYFFNKNYFVKIITFLIISGLFYLVILSGSRTALVFIFSYIFFLAFNFFKHKSLFALISLFFMIFIYFVMDKLMNLFSVDVYDRGSGGNDTRTDAWLIMLNAIYENPLVGYGVFNGASENSYFRLAANYGIFYAFFYILILIYALFSLRKKIRINQDENLHLIYCSFFGILISLAICGMLEGYMSDLFSLQVVIYFVILFVVGGKVNYAK